MPRAESGGPPALGPVVPIADPQDPRVDDYRNLTDAELRQRQEPAAGLFMVEGPAVIRQLLASSYPIRSMLLTETRLKELRADLPGPVPGANEWPLYVATSEVMRAVTGFHFHRGALAAAERGPASPWRAIIKDQRLIVVAEDLSDHENMGALFRNAAAFGVGAVLLSPGSVDPLYRRAVRVSMGQVLRIPWARAEPWPAAIAELTAAGFCVVALTPDPASLHLPDVTPTEGPVAILVGAEGPGLSAAARAEAGVQARIPMPPGVDSVNVATAAAIAFYELVWHWWSRRIEVGARGRR